MPQKPPDKPPVLSYGRPAPRRHRGFLPHGPFWRNWLFGVCMIGFSFLVMPFPNDRHHERPVLYTFMIAGALVIVASVVHAIGVFLGNWQDR